MDGIQSSQRRYSSCLPGTISFPSSSFLSSSSPIPWILASVVCGAAPTPFVVKAIRIWYKRIRLPSYTPPDKLFAPVWTCLYAIIGYTFWIIMRVSVSSRTLTTTTTTRAVQVLLQQNLLLYMFILHYILNISWAPIFFGCKNLRLGHVLNTILLCTLVCPLVPLIYIYVHPWNAILLLPYVAWLTLATRLSHDICTLNPTDACGYNNATFFNDMYLERKKKNQ